MTRKHKKVSTGTASVTVPKPEVTFMVEPWSRFKIEAAPLWIEHWKEVAINQAEIPLKVDYRQFDQQDATGSLHIIVARHQGVIIGYWLGFVRPHFHYADSLTAYTDIYYLDPAFRNAGTGAALFGFVEKSLKQRGVQKIFTATKCHLDHSALFEALGYNRTEIVFTKLLED